MTVTELTTFVLARLESETSSPTFNSINSDQWTRWADDKIPGIVQYFIEQKRFDIIEPLLALDTAVTISSGSGPLSGITDFGQAIAFKVTSAKIECRLLTDPSEFAKWDSSSFLTTPREERPIAIIMSDKVHIKPSSVSNPSDPLGYLDYVKIHPSLTGSQETLFKTPADELLVEQVYQLALESLQLLED